MHASSCCWAAAVQRNSLAMFVEHYSCRKSSCSVKRTPEALQTSLCDGSPAVLRVLFVSQQALKWSWVTQPLCSPGVLSSVLTNKQWGNKIVLLNISHWFGIIALPLISKICLELIGINKNIPLRYCACMMLLPRCYTGSCRNWTDWENGTLQEQIFAGELFFCQTGRSQLGSQKNLFSWGKRVKP